MLHEPGYVRDSKSMDAIEAASSSGRNEIKGKEEDERWG
jgi:hypothetical protein